MQSLQRQRRGSPSQIGKQTCQDRQKKKPLTISFSVVIVEYIAYTLAMFGSKLRSPKRQRFCKINSFHKFRIAMCLFVCHCGLRPVDRLRWDRIPSQSWLTSTKLQLQDGGNSNCIADALRITISFAVSCSISESSEENRGIRLEDDDSVPKQSVSF